MSITVTHSEITHRYLMNKGKLELWRMLAEFGGEAKGLTDLTVDKATTKDEIAGQIMAIIRAAQTADAAEPQAYHDLAIPFGAVTTDADGKHWVFGGWASTSMSREAYFTRELQLGDRLSPVTPWSYHCTKTETLLRKFPDLERYRR